MSALRQELREEVGPDLAALRSEIQEIKAMLKNIAAKDQDKLISLKDAAEALGISQQTLSSRGRAGKLTIVRHGRKIFFPKSEIFATDYHK